MNYYDLSLLLKEKRSVIMACDSGENGVEEHEIISSNPELANTKNPRGFYASCIAQSDHIASPEWRELEVSREPGFDNITRK
jgi:hypothetical protein